MGITVPVGGRRCNLSRALMGRSGFRLSGLFLFIATLLANQGTHTTSARGAPALCSPSGRASVVVITQIIHMTDTTRACDESLPSIRCCREMHSDVAGRSIYCDPILDGHNIPGRS